MNELLKEELTKKEKKAIQETAKISNKLVKTLKYEKGEKKLERNREKLIKTILVTKELFEIPSKKEEGEITKEELEDMNIQDLITLFEEIVKTMEELS